MGSTNDLKFFHFDGKTNCLKTRLISSVAVLPILYTGNGARVCDTYSWIPIPIQRTMRTVVCGCVELLTGWTSQNQEKTHNEVKKRRRKKPKNVNSPEKNIIKQTDIAPALLL